MITRTKHIIFLILIFLSTAIVNAQVLDASESLQVTTKKGIVVTVFKKANTYNETTNQYYYVPVKLEFSKLKNNTPEFSFLTYKKGTKIDGAILHFLMRWGLSRQELQEVADKLKKLKGNKARFVGAVIPELDTENPQLCIKGNSKLVAILNKSATTIGKTPLFPNSKLASSFKLNAQDAIVFNSAIQNNANELKKIIFSLSFVITYKNTKHGHIQKSTFELKQSLYKLLNEKP